MIGHPAAGDADDRQRGQARLGRSRRPVGPVVDGLGRRHPGRRGGGIVGVDLGDRLAEPAQHPGERSYGRLACQPERVVTADLSRPHWTRTAYTAAHSEHPFGSSLGSVAMRTYAPADATTVLDRLLAEPSIARGVVHHAVIPAREAVFAPMPDWLDPRIVAGLAARGIEQPYTHQAEAIEAVHAGEDVVVVTPTASGKTLCYALPILQAIAEDPSARALFLFPTKALGQDQVAEFGELAAAAGLDIVTSTYDGDTPAPIRSKVRAAGQVVVTNPDMLHSAILPHHTKWFQLFEQLRSSSSTSCTPTAACSAGTSPTSCAGCSGSAPTTAATRSSCAARRRSGTRPSWRRC